MSEQNRPLLAIQAELNQIKEAFDKLVEDGIEADYIAALDTYLGNLKEERDAKLDAYAKFMAKREMYMDGRRKEAARITALADADERAITRAKERLKFMFEQENWAKVETAYHKFSICKNGGKTPVIIDPVDIDKVPDDYKKVETTVNTGAVREALEAGKELEFARLGERGTHLRIK